jgi:D-serine deaminase-like pyridoxal phosphate-dependent protein
MWFEIDDSRNVATPALVFYRKRIEDNIQKMVEIAGNPVRLAPHIKTHKCPNIVRMQQDRGINRFKCATIAEADMLGECKAGEVILAYQPVGPAIHRFMELQQVYPETDFSCLCDNPEVIREIDRASQEANLISSLYIDLDCGHHRTGIAPSGASDLAQCINSLNSVELKGIHVYDGHLHDPDFATRKKKALSVEAVVMEVRDSIDSDLEVVIGGSPTFPIHALKADFFLSPGTTVLWDKGYGASLEGLEMFHPAALVVSRVISNPEEGTYCLDAGHKAISAEHQQPPMIFGLALFEVVTHSEEHLAIRTNTPLSLGQVLYLVPHHICPTVALHEEAIVVEDNKITGRWPIYRQRKIRV